MSAENRDKELAVIIMGSKSDKDHASIIKNELVEQFGVSTILRIASAHKNTEEVMEMVQEYNATRRLVYIAVAGGSNALGGVIETHTTHPVINCPPLKEPYGWLDVYSSIRMPSGVGTMFVMEPKSAALAVAKIFANNNPEINDRVARYLARAANTNTYEDQALLIEQGLTI